MYFGTDGALPPLVALLRSPQLAVQEQAAVILRNLSLTAENERNIIQEGGLPAVIALLRTNEPRLQVPPAARSPPREGAAGWRHRAARDPPGCGCLSGIGGSAALGCWRVVVC